MGNELSGQAARNGKPTLIVLVSILALLSVFIGRNAIKSDMGASAAEEAYRRAEDAYREVSVVKEREQTRHEAIMRELEQARDERAEIKLLLKELSH